MDKFPMTVHGYEKLKKELQHLKSVERPKIIREIETARAHGDLRENAEYQYAKEKQGFVEGRIKDIEYRLAAAEVIDITKLSGNRAVFGAVIEIEDQESGEVLRYQIVGEEESDISQGKISISSPLARAFIGRQKESEVQVKTPKGTREYILLGVYFNP